MKKSLKKTLSVVLAVILVFGCSTVAFAAEPVVHVTTVGDAKYPGFHANGDSMFCIEVSNRIPETGREYTVSQENAEFPEFDTLFIAEYLIGESDNETQLQVLNQLLYGIQYDYDASISCARISDEAYQTATKILGIMENLTEKELEEYCVVYTVYATEAPESGKAYQLLLDADVFVVACEHANTTVTEVTTDATCTVDGSKVVTTVCDDCGEVVTTETIAIAANGHVAAEAVEENHVAPTCTENGSKDKVIYCSVCNEELSRETIALEATGHDYKATTTASTCTTAGAKTFTCAICGDTYADAIDALGHTEEIIPAVAPTCTATGTTEGTHCSVCDAIITAPTIIDALGHAPANAVEENYVAPTCITTGSKDVVVYCSVCDEELSRETIVIDALGHTEETLEAVAPTCEDTGLTEGKKCTVCGVDTVVQNTVDALGHDMTNVVAEAVAPTCTTTGSTTVVSCTRCGLTEGGNMVDALGHSAIAIDGTPATCTEVGLTTGFECDVCGETLKAQEKVPATGHSFGEWTVVREATVEAEGLEERVCSACGFVESRPIDKLEQIQAPEESTTQAPVVEEPTTPEFNVPNVDVPDINIDININTGNPEEETTEETTDEVVDEVVEEIADEVVEEVIDELPTLDNEINEEPEDNVLSENVVFTDVEIPNTDAGVGFGTGKLIAAIFFTGTGIVAVKNKKKKLNGLVDDDEEVDDE